MFVMTNQSMEHTTHFEWHVTSQKDSQVYTFAFTIVKEFIHVFIAQKKYSGSPILISLMATRVEST